MAAGDSTISIVNIGLAALGEDPISDINAGLKRAIGMKGAYDRVRRETLEAYPWRHARKMEQIAASSSPPPFGYSTAFDLPAGFLRTFEPKDPSGSHWEILGNQILGNFGAPLNLIYIYDHTDPTKWPPQFCKAFGLKLAEDQCEYITGSSAKLADIQRKLGEALPRAQTASAQSASPREWDNDVLLRSRF